MENQPVEKAKDLLRRYPGITFPADMEKLVAAEGCELVKWPFEFPVKEVKRGRWIGVATGLTKRSPISCCTCVGSSSSALRESIVVS